MKHKNRHTQTVQRRDSLQVNWWPSIVRVYVRLLENIPVVVVVVRHLNMCWVWTRVWTTSSFLLRARFECLFMSLPWELMTWLLTGFKIKSEHEFFRTRNHGFVLLQPPIQNGLKHEALPDKTLRGSGWREISKNGCWQHNHKYMYKLYSSWITGVHTFRNHCTIQLTP